MSEVTTWKTILSEKMADCRVFDVYRDVCVDSNEEREATFYRLQCNDWCNIIPVTANNEVVLIEQARHGISKVTLEIPGGIVDEGESPQDSAVRELLEETGYAPREVVSLGFAHPNPAIQSNRVHFFLALDCEKKQEPSFDAHENVAARLVPVAELQSLVENGEITHSLVVASLFRFFLHQNGQANEAK